MSCGIPDCEWDHTPDPTICRVYWGSHGCSHERGHDGPHECACCDCETHTGDIETDDGCVGKPPYYGPETTFYGDDSAALGSK